MANFDAAFHVVMKHEGGYVNNPMDRGGPTHFGVTQGDLAHWYNRPVSIDEIKNLDIELAKKYYIVKFWDHLKLEAISNNKIATLIFDQGILRGPGRIIQDIQHILKLDPDGIMGPDTIHAINNQQELPFGIKIIEAAQLSLSFIVQGKPSQVEFLAGWISRTHSLLDYLLFSV